MLKPWLVALLALVMLAPLVQAAPADGRIEATSLTLEPGTLSAMGIGLRWEQDGVPTLEIQADQVSVRRVGTRDIEAPLGIRNTVQPVAETGSHERATLRMIAADGVQIVGLKAIGQVSGDLGALTARATPGVMLGSDGSAAESQACDQGERTCVEMFGAYELATTLAALQLADGTLDIILRGPTLEVSDADGVTTYASGREEGSTGELPATEDTWVYVTATGAAGALAAQAPAPWYALAPTFSAPALSLADAEGGLRVGIKDYRAHGDELRADGDLDVSLDPVASATHDETFQAGIVYADGFTAQIHGDVQTVNLAATPVFVDEPAQAAGFLAILLAAGAALAWSWQHLAFGLASLYTRLQKPDILDNEVRNAIYDIIRQHPGISAREVHRQSGQSWGTVVYHLRQLERHHLVVSRALGRTRNYYENHGKYKGMEVQLACLQSDRARTLASAIVAQPGITQEQLAAATGFPQPTTSYYVRKLKQAGLVEEQRDGRYAKYVPIGEVARFVELASAAPSVGTNAPAGVAP